MYNQQQQQPYLYQGLSQPIVQRNTNTLLVTGEGTLTVVPDQAIVTLGVITENIQLSTAQKENNDKTSAVIQSLLAMGVKNEDIQTTSYRIEPQYNYEDGKQIFRGYQVSHQLKVTIRDIAKTGQIIDRAVASGANSVTSIEFSISSINAYYNQALALAIQNAQLKALTIAKELKVTLNPIPFHIKEQSKAVPPQPIPFQAAEMAQKAAVPVQPGETKITAAADVSFIYY
ncbi:SIMPL domain-containing protein [Fictibacillus aquaticus]|nr:SIMPL domain-containing protein [Fictibacillus aquaticus]